MSTVRAVLHSELTDDFRMVYRCFFSNLGGGMTACRLGQCGNVTYVYNTLIISVFTCDPFTLCDALNISYRCSGGSLLQGLTACCCGDSNACNYRNPGAVIDTTIAPTEKNVTCFTGTTRFIHGITTTIGENISIRRFRTAFY